MGIPARQTMKVGWYLLRNRVAKRQRFALVVELEPLFACNLACPGCGKIQYPTEDPPPAGVGRAGRRSRGGVRRSRRVDRRW